MNTQLALERRDPLRRNVDLSYTGTYFPAGFRLELVTNSRDVLAAAAEAWSGGCAEFPSEPIRFHVVVEPEGQLSPQPKHRMQGHLYSAVADADNFAHIDLKSQFGYLHVSQQTAADHTWLRWYFVESLAYLVLAQRYLVPVHAACVARNGAGILLTGPSGAGKSTLAYALARAGWTYVTDDCTWLLPGAEERIAIGQPRRARFRLDAPSLFPELEGYAVRARPTGKLSIEIPFADLPHIATARRAPIGGIVFLDRRPGKPSIEPLAPIETAREFLGGMPVYGPEVDGMHERTLRKLCGAPAWRMRYQALEDAIAILGTLEI